MVLFCQGLVKIDGSGTPLSTLNHHGHIDTTSGATLLHRFLENVFECRQRPRESAGDLKEAVVHGPDFYHDRPLLPGCLLPPESGHAADHRATFSFDEHNRSEEHTSELQSPV